MWYRPIDRRNRFDWFRIKPEPVDFERGSIESIKYALVFVDASHGDERAEIMATLPASRPGLRPHRLMLMYVRTVQVLARA